MLNTSNTVHKSYIVHTNKFYKVIYQIQMESKEQKEQMDRKKLQSHQLHVQMCTSNITICCTTLHNTHTLYILLICTIIILQPTMPAHILHTFCSYDAVLCVMYEIQLYTFSTVLKWPFGCQRLQNKHC